PAHLRQERARVVERGHSYLARFRQYIEDRFRCDPPEHQTRMGQLPYALVVNVRQDPRVQLALYRLGRDLLLDLNARGRDSYVNMGFLGDASNALDRQP